MISVQNNNDNSKRFKENSKMSEQPRLVDLSSVSCRNCEGGGMGFREEDRADAGVVSGKVEVMRMVLESGSDKPPIRKLMIDMPFPNSTLTDQQKTLSVWCLKKRQKGGEDCGTDKSSREMENNTSFWKDKWHNEGVLKDVFPRLYALERHQNVTIHTKLIDYSLVNSFRRNPRSGVEEFQLDNLSRQLARKNNVLEECGLTLMFLLIKLMRNGTLWLVSS
ncbi:hypothetical protein Tco_1383440 [Tanacetum coccineum]